MTSKKQICENRHTLPVLGEEHLKQVLFFSVFRLHLLFRLHRFTYRLNRFTFRQHRFTYRLHHFTYRLYRLTFRLHLFTY